ncbi:MAG: ArnT family glycosyltransferase [Candidatus Poribacteria bacterium]
MKKLTVIDWAFVLVLLSSTLLKLRHVGHRAITYWDEGFHAIVAKNLLRHPFKFTLYEQPWLPYSYTDWGNNHIWLHKPPMAMWLIALSYAVLGVNTFALRLPSVILSSGAVFLTYLIATELFDKRIGLIAAFWQGFNVCTFNLVHGYLYSDHIDIALLFWVEVACYLLVKAAKTGKFWYVVGSGIAQGLAYLSKSYLGMVAFGIMGVLWFLRRIRFLADSECRLRFWHLPVQLMSSVLTVAPWAGYCLIFYRKEYLYEHKRVLDHLYTDVESWGATWDRPLFDYMVLIYPAIYTAVLAACVFLFVVALRRRNLGEIFLLAWAVGVIAPQSWALTKTPSATTIAIPPLLMGFSVIIGRSIIIAEKPSFSQKLGFYSIKRSYQYTAIWLASMLAMLVISGGKTNVSGRDDFDGLQKFAPYIEANFWIISRLIATGALFAVLFIFLKKFPWSHYAALSLQLIAAGLTVFFAVQYINEAKLVTDRNVNEPTYAVIGKIVAEKLPSNACLLLDETDYGHHFFLMFHSGLSAYLLRDRDMQTSAEQARQAKAIPYLVTRKTYDYPLVFEDLSKTPYRVYLINEK